MIKKLCFLSSFYMGIILVLSCNDSERAGCMITDIYYNYMSVNTSTILQKKPPTYRYDIVPIGEDQVVLSEDMRLAFIFDFRDSVTQISSLCQNVNYPEVLNRVYALSPNFKENHHIDSFMSVGIKTIHAYDETHPENSDISTYFKFGSNSRYMGKYQPMDEIIQWLNVNSTWEKREIPLLVVLEQYPILPLVVEFEITFALKSGRVIATKTAPIFLKG